MGSSLGSCVNVCFGIGNLLAEAKHNKQECLQLVVDCIAVFVEKLPRYAITPGGIRVLDNIFKGLSDAEQLLRRVANMGPLVSLLSASWVREEFLQINRDLTNMFSILGSGEKLLDLTQARQEQLRAVQQELKRCDTFFEEQEEAASRLTSIAAAAKESRCPIRLLHRRLLEQLHEVEDVSALTPDELIDELRYLQLAAMYGTEEEAAEEGAGPLGAPGKKKSKGLDDTLQEFLVQQQQQHQMATSVP